MREYWDQLEKHRQLVGNSNDWNERPDNLTVTYYRKKEDLSALFTPVLGQFLMTFGGSLTYLLQDTASGNDNNLELDQPKFEQGLLKKWIEELPPGAECKLVLVINKTMLRKQVFGEIDGKMVLYFRSDNALSVLAKNLVAIEKEWFAPGQKFFLVLGDIDCFLVGDILHVLGGVTIDTIRRFVYQPLADAAKDKLTAQLNTRAAETHWQNGTEFIVPEYLNFKDQTGKAEITLKAQLNKHFLDLIIASLANYTHSEPSGLVALFEGQKRVEIRSPTIVSIPDEVRATWFEIYDWTYEDHARDKLAIVRNLITLQPYSPETENYGVITSNANFLLSSAKDHYVKFIGDSIKAYFDKLKDATTYVQSKVDSVGQQVSGLVDTFTKNLLATAGFLIGTVLWKIVDPKLAAAYSVIVFAFVAYMILILAVYYPITWWSYHLTCKEYNHSLELYKRSFTESDVMTFIGNSFDKRRMHFWVAFGVTALIHVLLLTAACVGYKQRWLQ